MVHEVEAGVHALELGILLLQFAQRRKMRHGHSAELILPVVVREFTAPVLPAGLPDLGSQFDLFQDTDYLALTEL